jgi:hypothetical protein
MRPQASKITTEGIARCGNEKDYRLYLQRVEQAVNNLAHSKHSIDLEVLFYAIIAESGVFGETQYTGNADTNYFLGIRDFGAFFLKFLISRNPELIFCKQGEEAIRLFIKDRKTQEAT